jgi:hypothetical protein
MAATITVEDFLGTKSSLGEMVFDFFKEFTDTEFIRQWSTDPSMKETYNIQVIESPSTAFGTIEVRTNGDSDTSYSDVPSSTKELSFYDSLQQKVFYKLVFPSHWAEEGISKPNITAKSNAFKLCWEIYKKYDLQPDRILPTKEEGVYIVYECIDSRGSRSLVIEAYNDAEIGIVVCDIDKKEIIYNEDIRDMDFENAVRIYKAKTR